MGNVAIVESFAFMSSVLNVKRTHSMPSLNVIDKVDLDDSKKMRKEKATESLVRLSRQLSAYQEPSAFDLVIIVISTDYALLHSYLMTKKLAFCCYTNDVRD